METGALPKGFKSNQVSANKTSANKAGIIITVGILAVALVGSGLFLTGDFPMSETPKSQMEPSTPVMQQEYDAPLSPVKSLSQPASYASSAGDLYGYLEFKISNGDIKSMTADDYNTSLVIAVDTYGNGEMYIDLDEQFIGSLDDGTYFVIVDNEEFDDYMQAGTELYIPFEMGTEKIEIVGSYILS